MKKNSFFYRVCVFSCLSFFWLTASHAEIYKWVGEQRNAHYGDSRDGRNKQGGGEVVQVKDHLTVKRIPDVSPVAYVGDKPSVMVVFSNLSLEIATHHPHSN